MKNAKVKAVVSQMPELSHWPNKPSDFDITKSEVLAWLLKQPEVLNWLVQQVKDCKAIVYNPEKGTWKGAKTVVRNCGQSLISDRTGQWSENISPTGGDNIFTDQPDTPHPPSQLKSNF